MFWKNERFEVWREKLNRSWWGILIQLFFVGLLLWIGCALAHNTTQKYYVEPKLAYEAEILLAVNFKERTLLG